MGIPAVAGAVVILVLNAATELQQVSLNGVYLQEAKVSIAEKNYPRAEMLLNRVLQQDRSTLSDAQYAMAVLLDETDRKDRASQLFELLAPYGQQGNRAAHRRLAIILANKIRHESSPADLRILHWHLTSSGDRQTAEMRMAWGQYSLMTGDLKSARAHLLEAVGRFPEIWQTLGAIEARMGQVASATSSYEKSSEYLSKRLAETPDDADVRTDYARVLIKLGRMDQARIILEQGRLLHPDGPWPYLLASLAVGFHDLKSMEDADISELLGYISRALEYDANHGPALKRLMAYATARVDGNFRLKEILAKVIAGGKQPALAHVAMGNLCWLEENHDQALIHFRMAMEFRSDMPVLMNNLAWLLAHDEKAPDLDRALALVTAALEQQPEDSRFLDTRGTIFYLQENWKRALTDLEKSLGGVSDRKAVHRKLATVYEKLELPEIAEQHRLIVADDTRD